jgi:beta-glucosidase
LIKAVHDVNPNTLVVLIAGSPVEIYEWVDEIPVVIMGWYAGMEGGHALADVIFGDINPSGKLPFTFPVKLEDSPAHKLGEYPGENNTVKYNENIFVGYRYFDTENVEPQFCFGHGLSFTNFKYSDLTLNNIADIGNLPLMVSLKVKNIGTRAGSEVVQLYVGDAEATVDRPIKELKAFNKVYLKTDEEKEVTFMLDRSAFAFYDVKTSTWKIEPGFFNILIGSSSRDIRLSGNVNLTRK